MVVTFFDRAGHRERLVSAPHAVPYSAPSAPRIRRVLSGRPGGEVTARVVWSRPASTGGAGISGYKVVALELRRDGSVAGETSSGMLAPSARALTMRLDRGRYRFVVRAYNVNGASAPSRSKAVVAR